MSTTIKHLDHLNMSVESFAETAAWYRRVFGFEVVEQGLQEGLPWGVLRAGDALLCVYEHPGRVVPDKARRAAEGLHGVSHFALRITDRAAWQRTLAREGVETYHASPVEWPHSTAWYVRDPSGYEIEVAAWHGDEARFD